MNFIIVTKIFKKSYGYIWFLALFLAFFGPIPDASASPKSRAFDSSLVVFSPTSMTSAMHEIIRLFANQNNISVSGTFESSSELTRFIEDGEQVNIFISEDSNRMLDLQRMGVLNVYSLTNIASDSLVLVAPKNSYLTKRLNNIESTDDKLRFVAKNVSLAIPDPELDAAGFFAKQAFEKIGEWAKVESKMLKTATTENGLYLAANGDSAAVIYKTDAMKNKNIELLLTFPAEYHDKIIYQSAVVAGLDSEDTSESSENFMKFLKSDIAKSIFKKYGFGEI